MALIALALAWLGAITMVAAWAAPWWLPALTLACLLPVAVRRWIPGGALLVATMAVFAAVGALRFDHWESRQAPALAAYAGSELVLEGVIGEPPDPGRTVQRFRVAAERVLIDGRWQDFEHDAVLITVSQYADYPAGTPVTVDGVLDQPESAPGFDYHAYLLRRGIAGTMFFPEVTVRGPRRESPATRVDDVRLALERGLTRVLPEPEASLAAGLTVGRDGGISDELNDDYRRSGLAHIIAVSGSNVAILAAVVFLALVPAVGRNMAILPAALVAVAYVLLAGADWPVIRAGAMAAIYLFGLALGRQDASLAALAAATIAMTLVSPGAALEPGFQLSVAATAGLVVFSPWIRHGIRRAALSAHVDALVPSFVEQVAALSLAATLTTLPIAWITFGRISLVGPLANVLAEPFFALAFVGAFLAAVAAVAWEPLGVAAGLVAYYPLATISGLATTLGNQPAASVALPEAHAGWGVAAYVAMLPAGWLAYRYPAPVIERAPARGNAALLRRVAIVCAVTALAVIAWKTSLAPIGGPGDLEVTMLDVGQGSATLVTTPGGRRVLIDGGASGIETAGELGARMPHWQRDIDTVIVTHPQQDHLGGLPAILARYDVGTVRDAGATNPTEAYAALREAASATETLGQGDAFTIDGVHFAVLWPPRGYETSNLNNQSLVVRIEYGAMSVLVTGDIERAAQSALLAEGIEPATVLLVPHHGAATSLASFFDAVDAPVALISAGEGNPFGHPRDETLAALGDALVLRSDLHGRVTVRSDGASVEVAAERWP